MKWIGLTGGIATGKSTVAKILRDLGLPVIDADSLAREVTAKDSDGYNEIVKFFGSAILMADGEIDRRQLGVVVFKDKEKLLQLESITHPRVQELKTLAKLRLENDGVSMAFYEVPLLFEKNLSADFDKTIVVSCSKNTQIDRMRLRDQLSDDEIQRRLSNQLPMEAKIKKANYIIINESSVADLKNSVLQVLADMATD
jgi:dephospho-CoA kinase